MSKLKPCPICGEQPDYQAFNATTCGGRIICSCGLEIRQGRNETREAIEAIWNTRADDAAELRDVLDLALDSKRVAEHEVSRLYAENAKLRELAAILCHCMRIKASCDDCRINGHKGELARDPLCACDGLHEMLRELGIEVSG